MLMLGLLAGFCWIPHGFADRETGLARFFSLHSTLNECNHKTARYLSLFREKQKAQSFSRVNIGNLFRCDVHELRTLPRVRQGDVELDVDELLRANAYLDLVIRSCDHLKCHQPVRSGCSQVHTPALPVETYLPKFCSGGTCVLHSSASNASNPLSGASPRASLWLFNISALRDSRCLTTSASGAWDPPNPPTMFMFFAVVCAEGRI